MVTASGNRSKYPARYASARARTRRSEPSGARVGGSVGALQAAAARQEQTKAAMRCLTMPDYTGGLFVAAISDSGLRSTIRGGGFHGASRRRERRVAVNVSKPACTDSRGGCMHISERTVGDVVIV